MNYILLFRFSKIIYFYSVEVYWHLTLIPSNVNIFLIINYLLSVKFNCEIFGIFESEVNHTIAVNLKQSSRFDELWRFKLEFPLIEALKRLLISLIGLQKTDHVRNENLVGILWLFNAHPCSQPADFKQCYNRMKKTKEKNTCQQFAVIHMASICSSLFYVCFKKVCCYYAKALWTGRISVVCFFSCKKMFTIDGIVTSE